MKNSRPTKVKFNPDTPVLDLIKSSYPSFELSEYPLLKKYGYIMEGICEKWIWYDSINRVSELELWKLYALIQADWLTYYKFYEELYTEKARKEVLE